MNSVTQDYLIELYGEDAVQTFISIFSVSRLDDMPEAYCGKYNSFNDFQQELDYSIDEYDGTYIYKNSHIFYSDF